MTAVYVFDTWIRYLRAQEVKIGYQCHDEWLGNIQSKGTITSKVLRAIEQVNEELKLNITVACSIDFGENYASVH